MYFQHAPAIWRDFPALVPGALHVGGITADAAPDMDDYIAIAKARLADGPESEFPEIQAWRRAFAAMGLKPTQYRCAAESLLRRFRKEGSLPRLHPLVDLCNAVSMAFAVPVAVLDAAATGAVLIVAEALHEDAATGIRGLTETLATEIARTWPATPQTAILTPAEPRFTPARP